MYIEGVYDNRFQVAVNKEGRWIPIAYADHLDEAQDVARRAHRRHGAARITQGDELVDTFGRAQSGSLIGPNPRVVLDVDDTDMQSLDKSRDLIVARMDNLSLTLGKAIKMGGYAFAAAGLLALLVLYRTRGGKAT